MAILQHEEAGSNSRKQAPRLDIAHTNVSSVPGSVWRKSSNTVRHAFLGAFFYLTVAQWDDRHWSLPQWGLGFTCSLSAALCFPALVPHHCTRLVLLKTSTPLLLKSVILTGVENYVALFNVFVTGLGALPGQAILHYIFRSWNNHLYVWTS